MLYLYVCRGSSYVYWKLRLFYRGCRFLVFYYSTTILNKKILIYISFVTLREETSMSFNKSLRRIDLYYELKTSGTTPQNSNPSSLFCRVCFFCTLWREALAVAIKKNNPYKIIMKRFFNKNFFLETILKIFGNSD